MNDTHDELSTGAQEALRWLFSDEAMDMSIGHARKRIETTYGEAVSAELQGHFGGSQNESSSPTAAGGNGGAERKA